MNKSVLLGKLKSGSIQFFIIIGMVSMGAVEVHAFQFSENTSTLVDVRRSTSAWGDYDNDGDLDLAVSGYNGATGVIRLYKNNNGTFTIDEDPFSTIYSVHFASLVWGDYDNDGDLDLVVSGRQNSGDLPSTFLYENTNGTFAVNSTVSATLTNVQYSALAWGDYDNDGNLDLVVSGTTNTNNTGAITTLYKNDGNGGFTDSGISLPNVYWSALSWGDYDNDGDLDLAISGIDDSDHSIAKVFKNDGSDGFSDSGATIEGTSYGDIDWGDYDNDGDLDLAISGYTDTPGTITRVYKNTGSHVFTNDAGLSLTGVRNSALSWNDYDNDGDYDLLVTGTTTGSQNDALTNLYENDGSGGLTEFSGSNLPDIALGAVSFGDYDNDGDADLVLSGMNSGGNLTKVFENIKSPLPLDKTLPGAYWSSSDWGDYDNDGDLDFVVAGFENPGINTRLYTNNGDGTFTVNSSATFRGLIHSAVAWGDYNNDGYLDLVITGGESGSSYFSELYANNKNGTFTLDASATSLFEGVLYGDVVWGDIDNDLDLDLVISGETSTGQITQVYNNNGDGTFSTGQSLTAVEQSSLSFGDYDNDGDLDLMVTGTTNGAKSGSYGELYQNTNGTFTEVTVSLDSNRRVRNGGTDWGDYDNDGDLDLVITGKVGSENQTTNLYENSNGLFSHVAAVSDTFIDVENSSVAFGDYDGDSDLDLIVSGLSNSGRVTRLYDNNSGVFTTNNEHNFEISGAGSLIWVDYNNDGKLDLSQTGYGVTGGITKLYKNTKTTTSGPGSITGLTSEFNASVNPDSIIFSWTKVTDANNNNASIDYNLYLVNVTNPDTLIAGLADTTTGFRRTLASGNVGIDTDSFGFKIPDGFSFGDTYRVGVQAIDLSLRATSFSSKTIKFNGFVEDTSQSLINVSNGDVAWGDYDNDSDLDLIISGESISGNPVTKLYKNNGSEEFTEVTGISLPGAKLSSVAWGDYDNDGDLDLAISGSDASSNPFTVLYENSQVSGSFVQNPSVLAGFENGSPDWGDFDNDGDLDLLVHLYDDINPTTVVFLNQGDGSFSNVPNDELIADNNYLSEFGDFDNDGDLDHVISGQVYERMGTQDNFGYTIFSNSMTHLEDSSHAWGDYDNDGDLDLIVSGSSQIDGAQTKLYKNYGHESTSYNSISYHPPTILNTSVTTDTLTVEIGTTSVILSDGERSVTHNVYIASKADETMFAAQMADTTTGYRRVAAHGNIGYNSTYKIAIDALPIGNFVIGVQEIETNFKGGPFSTYNFTKVGLLKDTTNSNTLTNISESSLAWGDYDNDGDLDLAISGTTNGATGISKIFENDGAGSFTEALSLTGFFQSAMAWADYDNDGDVDLIISGYDGTDAQTILYENSGGFINTGIDFPDVRHGSVAWNDFDMDGDLDLAISGTTDGSSNGALTRIYLNDNEGGFSDSGISLRGLYNSAMEWADFNNDGFSDLIVTGYDGAEEHTILYKNNGAGGFSDSLTTLFTDVALGDINWGDYNNDGYLDVIIAGTTNVTSSTSVTEYYANNRDGTFTKDNSNSGTLINAFNSSLASADYDNDGDIDVAISGTDGSIPVTKLYVNTNGVFSETLSNITALKDGDLDWADVNADGELDLIITGLNASSEQVTELYTSIINEQNYAPVLPVQNVLLNINLSRDSLIVQWIDGSDAENGPLSYNVHVENVDVPQEYQLSAVMADLTNGYRRIPKMGNAGIGNQYKIGLLDHPVGTYQVRVQAIDAGFKSSSLGEISETVFSPVVFTITDSTFVLYKGETNILPVENLLTITDYYADSTVYIRSESPSSGSIFLDINNDSTKNEGEKFLTEHGIEFPIPNGAKIRINDPMEYGLDSLKLYLTGTTNQNVNPDSTLLPILKVEGTPTIQGNENDNGWYLLANPFTTTIGELLANVWTQGAVNSDAPTGGTTLYRFDEQSGAYAPITGDIDADTLDPGEGILAFIFEDDTPADNAEVNGGWPKTLTNFGNPFGESVTIPIKAIDGDGSGNTNKFEGLKLFGNPFGWELSIDSLITELVNIDPLTNRYVYSWDPVNKYYVLKSSGAIDPYESVFIRTVSFGLDDEISLEYDDIYETTPTKTVVDEPFQFVLNHKDTEVKSRSSIQFSEEEALAGIDPFDGYYLGSYASMYANLYTQIGDQNLTINNLPLELDEILEFPMYLDATVSGDFSLEWNKERLPIDWTFTLEEVATGTVINLKKQDRFSFSYGMKVKAVVTDSTIQQNNEELEPDDLILIQDRSEDEEKTGSGRTVTEIGMHTKPGQTNMPETESKSKASSSESTMVVDPLFVLSINPLTSTGSENGLGIPTEVELDQNYPNPFNPSSVIRFGVPSTANVQLEVYDILGRKVMTLVNNELKQPGRYNVQFDARNMASGMYIYRLIIGDKVLTKMMTLIK